VSPMTARSSGRPRSSNVEHPGASWERHEVAFPSSPRSPHLPTALGGEGLLTLTLRGKAVDGFEAQQERNRPQLSHRAWKAGKRPPASHKRQQAAALRRGAFARSFSSQRTERTIHASQTLATQSNRPPNRGSFTPLMAGFQAPINGRVRVPPEACRAQSAPTSRLAGLIGLPPYTVAPRNCRSALMLRGSADARVWRSRRLRSRPRHGGRDTPSPPREHLLRSLPVARFG
jgi:hypothetical protein